MSKAQVMTSRPGSVLLTTTSVKLVRPMVTVVNAPDLNTYRGVFLSLSSLAGALSFSKLAAPRLAKSVLTACNMPSVI
ncbi:hypothetical protein SEUCBS139899_009923 [Sporothrix eucalyptigena]